MGCDRLDTIIGLAGSHYLKARSCHAMFAQMDLEQHVDLQGIAS